MKILGLNENSIKKLIHRLMPILILGFVFVRPALCQPQAQPDKKAPLHVISDKMIALRDTSMVEFIGNVRATRLDSVLLADSVKVYFNEKTEKEKNSPRSNVKKIVSTGNVRFTDGDRKAFADQAVYTTSDETLVLTGNSPKLQTGTSFVTGKKITLYRNEDKVVVESAGSKRVEALFNPEDKPAGNQ